MELKSKIKNIYQNLVDDCYEIVLQANLSPAEIEPLLGKDLRVKLTKWSEKRSLDANAYFHVLCDKLRQANNVSMAHMKNDLITTYGQIDYISEGVPLTYKTNAPPEFIQEREEIHMKYIKPSPDGAFFYIVYRGSHTYDSKEMALLIDGTIAECKVHDIETIPPFELERMKQEWSNGKA